MQNTDRDNLEDIPKNVEKTKNLKNGVELFGNV